MGCRICIIQDPKHVEEPDVPPDRVVLPNSDPRMPKDEMSIEMIKRDNKISEFSIVIDDESIGLEVADPDAFNHIFIQQREQVINNTSYRSIIESWQPETLQHLAEIIKTFAQGKSIIDRHWFIYYWIVCNIEYDVVAYFSKDYRNQTAEGVFRSRKGMCAGYANLYQYLCNQLQIPCEFVGGYSKGYGFDDREGAPTETNHAWNAVEIYHHWYLVESTWGAGHLNKEKAFERKIDVYYFLARPNEMIYHHLPENERWQLLKTPIQMQQYMQMPKLRPLYFKLELEMVYPRNQCFVNLEQDKPYALVIVKTPTDVYLMADLKLHDQKIDGGDRVIFNKRKRYWYCYFAPASVGEHKITIYAKRGDTDVGTFSAVLDLILQVKRMPMERESYPKVYKCFHDYGLKLLSPLKTHIIHLDNGEQFAEIAIRAPGDIQLLGHLKNLNAEPIPCGECVYYNREKDYWRCRFAPDRDGLFDAVILAKQKNIPGEYTSAILFKVNAKQITSPSYSFPSTWQLFYDFDLKVVFPVDRGIIVLHKNISSTEIHIKAPDYVCLSGQLRNDKDELIVNGKEVYYDSVQEFWRCKFTPNRNGIFTADILAKKNSDPGNYISVVSFKIDARQMSSESSSFLDTRQIFYDLDLKVVSPMDGSKIILTEKSSFVEICLKTPDDVELLGQLLDINNKQIPNGHEVYYDRHKEIWRCKFAPDKNGSFDALIEAKKKSDTGLNHTAVIFHIEANHILRPPLTFPKTWQLFYDLDLKIKSPRLRSTAVWSKDACYAEVRIQAPDDVQLSCRIEYRNRVIENGALAQFDHERKVWQLLFAPEQIGQHELLIYGERTSSNKTSSEAVVMFPLNVTSLQRPMKFPIVYKQFHTSKCQIYTPLDGRLKKDSIVSFHCLIPDATSVKLIVDSKSLRPDAYENSVLKRQTTVGSEEVTICAKYGLSPHYTSLMKYFVE